MNDNKFSNSKNLRILACLAIDIAVILAFFKIFSIVFIMDPIKSSLMFFVLSIGLLILNGAVIFPNKLFKISGLAYIISTVAILGSYAVVANVFSVLLIASGAIWYIICQLIILAAFLVALSVVISFSKKNEYSEFKIAREQNDKNLITLYIMDIEDALAANENQESVAQCSQLFKDLKERIAMSTPFGRINGNSAVLEIENRVRNNLITLKDGFSEALTEEKAIEFQELIKTTQKLIRNRENLNIK